MLEKIQETMCRILYKIPSSPAQAQIEITNICNLDCKMCPREKLNVVHEHIPFERMKAIVDRLNGVKALTLTGWGEPFLHPRIFEMIRYAKQKGFWLQITTNGVFKNDSLVSQVVESGLDALSFSIDSPSNGLEWGHSSNAGMERMRQLIQARKRKIPIVTLQATVHKGGEEQVMEVIRLCKSVGGDRVNLGRLDTRFSPEMDRPDPREEKRIFRKAHQLGRELEVRVDCIQYAVSQGMERAVYRLLKSALHRMGRYCLKTYNYVYINNAGDVTPCCLLPNLSMGNILDEDLATIWKSSKFNKFRENQRKICGKCDLWRIKYSS